MVVHKTWNGESRGRAYPGDRESQGRAGAAAAAAGGAAFDCARPASHRQRYHADRDRQLLLPPQCRPRAPHLGAGLVQAVAGPVVVGHSERGRSDLSFDDMLCLDLQYMETWSLKSDLNIMWRTAGAVLRSHGAF